MKSVSIILKNIIELALSSVVHFTNNNEMVKIMSALNFIM